MILLIKRYLVNTVLWKILFLIFISTGNIFAQSTKQDTVTADTNHIARNSVVVDTVANELILEEINIEGEIDRPNVIIMPKRVETDMEKIDLERKFSEEINQAEGELPELEEELRKIERIESIKKTLKKDRTKKKNNDPEKNKKKD